MQGVYTERSRTAIMYIVGKNTHIQTDAWIESDDMVSYVKSLLCECVCVKPRGVHGNSDASIANTFEVFFCMRYLNIQTITSALACADMQDPNQTARIATQRRCNANVSTSTFEVHARWSQTDKLWRHPMVTITMLTCCNANTGYNLHLRSVPWKYRMREPVATITDTLHCLCTNYSTSIETEARRKESYNIYICNYIYNDLFHMVKILTCFIW